MPCACKVLALHGHTLQPEIAYCPTHAAAPALLAKLKALSADLCDGAVTQAEAVKMADEINALLATVEGRT